jgi:Undecaprenyl-phosphate galactose phosphotransferase WbaP
MWTRTHGSIDKWRFNSAVTIMVIFDLMAFCVSFLVACMIFPFEFAASLAGIPVFACICFLTKKSYIKHLSFLQESVEIVKISSFSFLIGFIFFMFWPCSITNPGIELILAWISSLCLLPLARYGGKLWLVKKHFWERTILILGAGETGRSIAEMMMREPVLGYRIQGFLADDGSRTDILVTMPWKEEIPVLGPLESAEEVIKEGQITDIIVAVPDLGDIDPGNLADRLQPITRSILLVTDLFKIPVVGEVGSMLTRPGLLFHYKNSSVYPANILVKRIVDLMIGSAALLLSLPIMMLISLIIKLDSQGPVFFFHTRIGRNGKTFKCWKFRTMHANAEEILGKLLMENPLLQIEWQKNFKLKDDPRVTRVGRLLRKTSLDELPQIVNVLKGEMSLVGPRPVVAQELARFGPYVNSYLRVRPGITGLWQVSGRSDTDYFERVHLDNWYTWNWSIWLDIVILLRTVVIVFNRRGAY